MLPFLFFFLSFQMHVQGWAGDRERPGRGRGVPDASAVIHSRNSNLGAKFTVPTWRLDRLIIFFFVSRGVLGWRWLGRHE